MLGVIGVQWPEIRKDDEKMNWGKTGGPLATRARARAVAATAVMTALLVLAVPAAAGSAAAAILYRGPVVQVSGSFEASVALDPGTCSSLTFDNPSDGLVDVFEVGYPSAGAAPAWYLDVIMPNPKSVYYSSTSTSITMHKGTRSWYHEFQEDPNKVPSSELHFSANGKSGALDLTLSPYAGTRGGPVHVTGSWEPGTCATKLAKGLPL
jgi:hypothetical protein